MNIMMQRNQGFRFKTARKEHRVDLFQLFAQLNHFWGSYTPDQSLSL